MASRSDMAYIGRRFSCGKDTSGALTNFKLSPDNPVLLDFSEKKHTFICSMTGGGKSYLAGVIVEELISKMENYAVVIIDPMGIFNTLNIPNKNERELGDWEQQLPGDIRPRALEGARTWVPAGDASQFDGFDGKFALRAPEFSVSTLCYAFNLDMFDPQANLFRKAQGAMHERKANYTMDALVGLIKSEGHSTFGFQANTVDALATRLDTLEEFGIITPDAPEISTMIRDGEAVVFDLSMSSEYTARVIINFLAEKIFAIRKRIKRKITAARASDTKIERPGWYIPPVQMVLDEAHSYLPGSDVLHQCIAKGRNCGLMITAISQSPNLTKDMYAAISRLFIGPMIYEDDITALRSMVPMHVKPSEFVDEVRALVPGTFLYYDIQKKTQTRVKIRPRYTLHPAETELGDERQYFTGGKDEPELFNITVTSTSCGLEDKCTIGPCTGRDGVFDGTNTYFDGEEYDGKPLKCSRLTMSNLQLHPTKVEVDDA